MMFTSYHVFDLCIIITFVITNTSLLIKIPVHVFFASYPVRSLIVIVTFSFTP